MPAFARQANVLHVPQLDARVRYVLNEAQVEALDQSKHLGGFAFVEVLELAAEG